MNLTEACSALYNAHIGPVTTPLGVLTSARSVERVNSDRGSRNILRRVYFLDNVKIGQQEWIRKATAQDSQ